ncbi:MAG: HNH endonuclease signature motif containing protein [Bacteroidota bacterium]
MSSYISKKDRRAVIERANRLCEYCLAPADYAFHPFCVDHIIAVSKGGKNDLENLAYSCQNCNGSKYNKLIGIDPLTQRQVSLFNPRTQNWTVHFDWNVDFTIVIGKTACGRATVKTLKMNLPSTTNIRTALVEIGVHPPR